MKKIIAIIFVLIANLILLAHAVLPHQHCQANFICFESTHCTEDATIHTQNSTEHNHKHDGTDNKTCILKQAVIILPNQIRILKDHQNYTNTQNHFFYIARVFEYYHLQPIVAIVRTAPYYISFYASFAASSLGLRAPPTLEI